MKFIEPVIKRDFLYHNGAHKENEFFFYDSLLTGGT